MSVLVIFAECSLLSYFQVRVLQVWADQIQTEMTLSQGQKLAELTDDDKRLVNQDDFDKDNIKDRMDAVSKA